MRNLNKEMFTNKEEVTFKDFEEMKKSDKYEIYSQESVKKFIEDVSNKLEKAENGELNDEGKKQLDIVKAEVDSLLLLRVVNADLTKSIWYIRENNPLLPLNNF